MAALVETMPLEMDQHGVYRVGGTRITLDSVVREFKAGLKPEEIVEVLKSVQLSDVHFVIGYYLRHAEDVERYLAERRRTEEELLAEHPEWTQDGLRERLLARQKSNS